MTGSFTYYDEELDYLDHPYNTTRYNERAVEVPIALRFAREMEGHGLEVGNVLNHYGGHWASAPTYRTVIDLHEDWPGVLNADVRTAELGPEPFDWMVAISTIEHIGWDPYGPEQSPLAAEQAIGRLLSWVRGPALVTIPLGVNPGLDIAILDGDRWRHPTRQSTMVTDGYDWHQEPGVAWRPYGATTRWAGAVWIAEWRPDHG